MTLYLMRIFYSVSVGRTSMQLGQDTARTNSTDNYDPLVGSNFGKLELCISVHNLT